MHTRHRDATKANLFNLVRSKDVEEETFVKFLIIYFMTTMVFPNTSLNIPTFTVRYANNLALLGHYTWVNAIHK